MKLNNKVLLSSTLTLVGFLALISISALYAPTLKHFFISVVFLSLCYASLTLYLFRRLFLKRLAQLNQNIIKSESENNLTERLLVTGNDELTAIAKYINQLLNIIEVSQKNADEYLQERTQELQITHAHLQQEITARESIEKELIVHKDHLVRLAHYDPLTALPNHVFFNAMLNKTLHHAARHQKKLAILFIDLDRFKNINDAFGDAAGDVILKEISQRFADELRSGDILARLGGDEFIILLNDIEHAKLASHVAEKLLATCAKPIRFAEHELSITASIGICVYPTDGASLEDLQKNADIAMYKAKRAGGSVFHYYTKEMHLEAHAHIQFETALRKAIQNNEFILYYQPQLNLADGTIRGVEALIRWENPELGLVNPAEFIPLAEETGLIMQIGEWALREACRANKAWQNEGYQPLIVAVNLSAKQFSHPDLTQLVATILQESGLEAHYLELEITETAVMDDVVTTAEKLIAIQQMGVRISVDDFGTGYTAISYLKRFPISTLKIDQTFIKNIAANQDDAAITHAIITLAHSLGMKVIAEGVETAVQLQYLADNNCDIVQGYYLSRPLPEQKVVLQFHKNVSTLENNTTSA